MNLSLHFKQHILLFFLLISCCISAAAQSVHGRVTDAKTGETLIGATVHIGQGNTSLSTSVKLDGVYTFNNVPAGTYQLQVTYIGYKTTKEYVVEVTAGKTATLNISMLSDATALNEVAIIESVSKETDHAARDAEKLANNTMNVVSASSIAVSPDVIVSNVLSRVSGISMDRSNTGDAQHVIIRGMDKQYNTTLINGVKIPSPDDKNRYVPLDIFPADLVEEIQVSKSLTPDMEGDASGGVVNLVMKTAPSHLRIEGNIGTGYSQIFLDRGFASFNGATVNSKSPNEINPGGNASISQFPYQNLLTSKGNPPPGVNASLTIGNRYLDNKLGIIISGTYQNFYQGDNSFTVVQENTVGPSPNINTPNSETAFQSSYNRQYSSQLSRLGTIASIDYKFNENNSINLFGTYLKLNEYRVRNTQTATYSGYSYQSFISTNSVDNETETRTDLQSIYNLTLKGKHKIFPGFSVDWTIAKSEASHKQPDDAQFKTTYQTSPDLNTGKNQPDPNNPGSSVFVTPDIINGPVTVGNESRNWSHNTDKDLSGYLNLHYEIEIFGRKAVFSAGGMFRHKTRDNFIDRYSLPYTPTGNNSPEPYTSIPEAAFTFATASPGIISANALGSSATDGGVYTFVENIQAGYGMVKYFVTDRLDFLLGLRTESTYQHFDSNIPVTLPGRSATINYVDYLPSVNIKYALTDDQALRASYFESILRPAFADLIQYPQVLPDDPYPSQGNPYLQHTVINNYDLRYEFFPGVFDEFMAGGFYKNLTNPIERFLQPAQSGATLFNSPANFGNAQNYGFEAVAKKFFGNIGASVNYTYTQSQITTPKSIDVTNVGVTTRNQTRPLQGQAANIGNASLLYKDQKNGIDAQLALSYIGERIAFVSRFYGLDTWEKPSTFLDFSAQKQLGKRFIVFVKANNLLNTPYELFIKQNNTNDYSGLLKYEHQESPKYTTVQYDQYYARYNLGLRFKF
jgi:TonB-dependent receptor